MTPKKRNFFIIFLFVLFCLLSENIFALKPIDFMIVYKYSWYKDGKVVITNYAKSFCQDSQKLRIESKLQGKPRAYIGNIQPIVIYRLDKHIIYFLNQINKTYTQGPVTDRVTQTIDLTMMMTGLNDQLVKVGEGKVLGYDCFICTHKDKPNIKYWFSKDFTLILKSEQEINDSKFIFEAVELRLEKQPDELFDIPSDYKLVK